MRASIHVSGFDLPVETAATHLHASWFFLALCCSLALARFSKYDNAFNNSVPGKTYVKFIELACWHFYLAQKITYKYRYFVGEYIVSHKGILNIILGNHSNFFGEHENIMEDGEF